MKGRWSSSDATQERILDAALKTFRERGYAESTMAEIVAASGVSTGSIYHHFGGKEELYAACNARLRQSLHESAGINPGDMPGDGSWEGRYLWAIWEARDECRVFLTTDAPRGFDPVANVAESYYADLTPNTARILAAVVVEALRILCSCAAGEAADAIASTVKLLNVIRAVGF